MGAVSDTLRSGGDAVLHVAAADGTQPDRETQFRVNYLGTLALLEHAGRRGAKLFEGISTGGGYGY